MASTIRRAKKICSSPECPHTQPCPEHSAKPWATSTRRQRSTLSGSRQQQRARYILQRDDTICHRCHFPAATEADHLVPLAENGPDTVENMAAICHECHTIKTLEEARRARSDQR